MTIVSFLAAFAATIISMVCLTHIALKYHDKNAPLSLSELAAAEAHLLQRFRKILLICVTLFAISVYGYIVPRLQHGTPVAIAWSIVYVGILFAAILPAQGKTFRPHLFAAQLFGVGMLALDIAFWKGVQGAFSTAELVITVPMAVLGLLTYVDKPRFIIYELGFVYLNHISIVIAAIALYK